MNRFLTASLTILATFSPAALASRVQVVHLSPDAPNVDVWVDGRKRLADVPYLGASDSLPARDRTYQVQVTPAGSNTPVIDTPVDIDAGSWYTLVAWDSVAQIKPALIKNDIDGIPAGHIRLQVTHTAVGVGNVDVWELSGGAKIIDDFMFGETASLDVPRGALELGLDLDEDAVPDVTFSVPDLGADTVVNVFAVADAVGVALYAVYPENGATARVNAN